MELLLIDGQFSATEAIAILTQLAEVKIKYHENKIKTSHNEEDIKMRERKIKNLQNELAEAREHIQKQTSSITIKSTINL